MNKKHEESFNKYLTKGGLPCIDIKINGNKYVFLLDSGSDISYIDTNVAEDIELHIIEGMFTSVATIGSNTPGAATYEAQIELTDNTIEQQLVGVELCATTKHLLVPFTGILGVDFLKKIGAQISFTEDKLIY